MEQILNDLAKYPLLKQVLTFLLNAVVVIVIAAVILRLSRQLFQKIRNGKNGINVQFGEKIFRFLVIFISVMWVVMSNDLTKSFGQSLFQSTAVIAAIAGFAAQSVLADLICGIILSATKPFTIGDRVELENGTAGVVRDMTLRHVVLVGLDTQIYIIPNSRMNAQCVKNMSYHAKIRSVDLHFSVSYDTDPEFACQVIRQAIMDSPLSVPGKQAPGKKEPEYGPVYFLAFKDSCLDMGTTAYFSPDTPTEVFKNDINTRVKKALEHSGIEIPYNYLNVVVGQKES